MITSLHILEVRTFPCSFQPTSKSPSTILLHTCCTSGFHLHHVSSTHSTFLLLTFQFVTACPSSLLLSVFPVYPVFLILHPLSLLSHYHVRCYSKVPPSVFCSMSSPDLKYLSIVPYLCYCFPLLSLAVII